MSDASTVPADFACVKHERKDGEEAWVVYLGGEHVLWSWDEADADRVARLITRALAARTAACARVAEAHAANARANRARNPHEGDADGFSYDDGEAAGCDVVARDIRALATGGSGCAVCAAAKVGAT
jgi:hypothetical protein